jgi:CubicO group peptidase (beta-lactamase class C family)
MVTAPVPDVQRSVNEIANRWPAVGLAAGVIRDGHLDAFAAHGLANIASATPVTEDTVFRIASVTKTFTAIAVMQLWEQGSIDLDEPANGYLRAYRLVPANPGYRQPTVRHLLTHTAGIREVLHPSGLVRIRDLGETVRVGQPVPSLAEFYRGALRYDADPGTTFCYTDHGFATLGQIVEDITGMSLDAYLRARIFEPLGMEQTDLIRSERVGSRLATGYELRSGGTEAVADYDLITVGGGGIYSTPTDMARYVAALLGGGGNEHGSVLKPETLATMFEPQFQPDPRVPGFGLGFFRTQVGRHFALEHDGILPGFDSQILLAPNDGVGVMAFANGAKRGMHWLGPESRRLLRQVLDVPDDAIRSDVPQHPEIWDALCGWYRSLAMGSDPARFALGPGVEVVVRRGDLMIRALSPIPALRRGFVLHPDDPDDPNVFRIEFPWFGLGTCRVVFAAAPGEEASAIHLDLAPISFERRSARTNPRILVTGAVVGAAVATAATLLARRLRREEATP